MERRLSKAAGARRLSIYVVGGVSLFLLLHVLLNSATYLVTAHPSGRAMRAILNRPIARRSQKLRILHLIDLPTHMSIMDRWFARSQVAFSSHGELVEDAPIWGPGFAEYHSNESLSDNIRLRYGASNYFDAVLPYYNTDQVAIHQQQNDSASLSRQLKELSQLGVVIVDRPHEMRDFRRRLFMSGPVSSSTSAARSHRARRSKRHANSLPVSERMHGLPAPLREPDPPGTSAAPRQPQSFLLSHCQ
jgi:hypothetical protein